MIRTFLLSLPVAAILLAGSVVRAQETNPVDPLDELVKKAVDEKPKPADAKPTAPADAAKTQDPKKPATPKSTTDDDEFLKGLVPDLRIGDPKAKGASQDELDRAIASMREAGRKINAGDVSDETQEIQKAVLDEIDKLIEKLKNQPPPPKSKDPNDNSNPQQNQQQNRQPRNQQLRPRNQQQQPQQQGQDQQPNQSSGEQKSKAAESEEENQRKVREAQAANARRQALINEVWGHLPPNVRERLLNVGSEKMLPKYEDMIRRYYESLAEGKNPQR